MLIKTKRGLEFTLDEVRQAEIFCEIKIKLEINKTEQREVALALYQYYKDKNYEKALKFSIIATNSSLLNGFHFNFSDAFNWYNLLRVFISNIHRVLNFFKIAFLPLWYPLLGLFYFFQVPVAHHEGDKDSREYWSIWAIFNTFTCLVLFGLIAVSGIGIAIATLVVSLNAYLFDVEYEIYKYHSERKPHENLLKKLISHRGEHDEFAQNLKNTIHVMKEKRFETFLANVTVMVGGLLFGLSAFLPPVFIGLNIIGASIILSAFIFMVGRKTYHSWTSPTGFLNHYMHEPLLHFFKNPNFYLKKYIYQPVMHFFQQASPQNSLRIEIPPHHEHPIELVSSSINSPGLIPMTPDGTQTSSPTSSLDESTMLIENKLQEANNFIEGVAALTPCEQKELRILLKTPNTESWNRLMETYVRKYKEEKKDNLYHCSLKRTIQICRNFYRSLARKEHDPAALKILHKEIRFLTRMEQEFNGDKKSDLALVRMNKEEMTKVFHSQDIDSFKLKNINRLVNLLGIKTREVYQKQYECWKRYYLKEQRVKTPFFDTPGLAFGKCSFEAHDKLFNSYHIPAIRVSNV